MKTLRCEDMEKDVDRNYTGQSSLLAPHLAEIQLGIYMKTN